MAKEAEEREKRRIEEGKVAGQMRKQLEVDKAKRDVDAAKRARQEEREHRRKVEAQIKADRDRRRLEEEARLRRAAADQK